MINKHFFKVVLGFFAILSVSFLILVTIGYYDVRSGNSTNSAAIPAR